MENLGVPQCRIQDFSCRAKGQAFHCNLLLLSTTLRMTAKGFSLQSFTRQKAET